MKHIVSATVKNSPSDVPTYVDRFYFLDVKVIRTKRGDFVNWIVDKDGRRQQLSKILNKSLESIYKRQFKGN